MTEVKLLDEKVVDKPLAAFKYDDLIKQYRGFTKQTADGIVRACQLLLYAETQYLEENGFKKFCADIGIEPNDSKHKKLKVIGANAPKREAIKALSQSVKELEGKFDFTLKFSKSLEKSVKERLEETQTDD
jgi:hypothetical protein